MDVHVHARVTYAEVFEIGVILEAADIDVPRLFVRGENGRAGFDFPDRCPKTRRVIGFCLHELRLIEAHEPGAQLDVHFAISHAIDGLLVPELLVRPKLRAGIDINARQLAVRRGKVEPFLVDKGRIQRLRPRATPPERLAGRGIEAVEHLLARGKEAPVRCNEFAAVAGIDLGAPKFVSGSEVDRMDLAGNGEDAMVDRDGARPADAPLQAASPALRAGRGVEGAEFRIY